MAVIRLRLYWTCALIATVFIYLALVHFVHQAVLQATRLHPQQHHHHHHHHHHQQQHGRLSSSHALPVITGYSIEMLFRTARRASCSVNPPTYEQIHWNNFIWQKIVDSPFYLFSSHWDDRLKVQGQHYPFVRMLAMVEGVKNASSEEPLYCQLWDSSDASEPYEVVEATVSEIWIEAWDPHSLSRSYRPYLVSCPTKTRPIAVSVVAKSPCSRPSTLFSIPPETKNAREKFAVCVKGLDFPDDISSRLVEWIELNSILGAKHFIFYVFNVHPNVKRVLEHYIRIGLVTRVPLTLPGAQPNEPRQRSAFLRRNTWQKRRNEIVPYNDCFYRLAKRFRFVLPIDVDEVVVPVQHRNWHALFDSLEAEDPNLIASHASLSAQQVYFFDDAHGKLSQEKDIPPYMHMLSRTRRTTNFTRAGHGIKSFIVSDNCLTVFNHYAMESLRPGVLRDVILPTRLVQLNHYKNHCPPEVQQDCPYYVSHMTTDRIVLRYKKELVTRVNKVLKGLNLI